ncbi:hypothetical protein ACFFLM_05855 [Deinococcus oregonensis]|uniref:Uncharacterized protein n=1 Tax=Deinococcus oregonensis TaxID=1805970 RepID=A0ABV6AWX8_9DEIO
MIVYTPLPLQAAFSFTPAQMARLDRRFAALEDWPPEPGLLVQESAALLNAHLRVVTPRGEWEGSPEAPTTLPPLTEAEWEEQTALGGVPRRPLYGADLSTLLDEVSGVVTTFRLAPGDPGDGPPRLSRRYRLWDEWDRLELEYLLLDGCPGVVVLRAHKLEDCGTMSVQRYQAERIGRPVRR